MRRTIVDIAGPINSGKSTLAELLVQADAGTNARFETSGIISRYGDGFNQRLLSESSPPDQDQAVVIDMTNRLLPDVLSGLGRVLGRAITEAEIAIDPADVPGHPEYYDKLFRYFGRLAVRPGLIEQKITSVNKAGYRWLLQWLGGYVPYRLGQPDIWYRQLFHDIAGLPAAVDFVAVTSPRHPAEALYSQSQGAVVVLINRPDTTADSGEVTEKFICQVSPDIRLLNDGDLDQLGRCARQLRRDAVARRPQSEYRAASFLA